ncbi:MAG: SAM-dependent methyltransferase [Epulopiscium sp. Nuni2H_MBin001]|nr:MAG: SAM-dependent methyltransferase [Epulopiscium sp. Nuni2H_MBin001]
MTNSEIVAKLWNFCRVLGDDGITSHQYVTELTYLLFLKMSQEMDMEKDILEGYRWEDLLAKEGVELTKFYKTLLDQLGEHSTGRVREIYSGATSAIKEPKNLRSLIVNIDSLDWFTAKDEGLGSLYEGLLEEKNAGEKNSGAGQFFTPRALIEVITELVSPQAGELCNDPACGTFGFMIAADKYVKRNTDDLSDLSTHEQEFQINEAFTGCELVHETHRLALMNALLHNIEGKILLGDTLSSFGKQMKNFDVVLANPPFGTKTQSIDKSKDNKKASKDYGRDDFTFPSSNKQLNFLQHIYRSLKTNGKARAGVVLPDNVLFADGDGSKIREDLMEKCNLHTVLRLPTGIFEYAKGVKTNVLFFTRGVDDIDNTAGVWFYDMRTNMPSLGKSNPLTVQHFDKFKDAFLAEDRQAVDDDRWSYFSREQIAKKNNSLDLGLIKDDSLLDYDDLPDPLDSILDIIAELEEAVAIFNDVRDELLSLREV